MNLDRCVCFTEFEVVGWTYPDTNGSETEDCENQRMADQVRPVSGSRWHWLKWNGEEMHRFECFHGGLPGSRV